MEIIIKDSPSAGDVHVDAPLGSQRQRRQKTPPVDTDGDGDATVVKRTFFKVSGIDADLGLVFGWGIVCKEGGKPYVDTQGDHIPDEAMVKASTEFMKNSRMAGEMHARMGAGTIVHSFPLTGEIAKAMGIDCDRTGWMVAAAPDPEMLAKFKDGTFTGFSIGGEVLGDDE
jgi:hypothetical protein